MKTKTLFIVVALALGGLVQGEYAHRTQAKDILEKYGPSAREDPDIDLKQATHLCKYCHGEDGNSKHSAIPSLAGQNPQYLVEQLLVFRDGARYPTPMHEVGKKMTPEIMAAVARHFAALPRHRPASVDTALATGGKALYESFCAECHGRDGRGANPTYSAIQSQMPEYVILTLTRFRDLSMERASHEMQVASRGLTDAEITSIAHYLAGL